MEYVTYRLEYEDGSYYIGYTSKYKFDQGYTGSGTLVSNIIPVSRVVLLESSREDCIEMEYQLLLSHIHDPKNLNLILGADIVDTHRRGYATRMYDTGSTVVSATILDSMTKYEEWGWVGTSASEGSTWYNNSTVEIQIRSGVIPPPGYEVGRLNFKKYHNGSRTIYLKDGEIVPDGYIRGTHHCHLKGTTVFNDGVSTYYAKPGTDYYEECSRLYTLGGLPTTADRMMVNNGTEQRMLDPIEALDLVNQGWYVGGLPDKKTSTRNKNSRFVHGVVDGIWMNKKVHVDELQSYLASGWVRGMVRRSKLLELNNVTTPPSVKVKSIKRVKLETPVPVYDGVVHASNPYFSLSAGVLSHNTVPAASELRRCYVPHYKGWIRTHDDYSG
ncbi:hypothetical protein VP150E351_P0109 [Vibrio phage 150E35-1]|nr:hypothetical protein VP150E351_P0109 [Vibrio phage 150E35-1]